MGTILSSLRRPTATSEENSRVKAFHSSAEWEDHFNDLKDSSKLLVIDFTASWCGPCQFIAPVFQALSRKFTDVEFAKIDVDELTDVTKDFNVEAMPTFVLVKKGKEIDRVVGARKDELKQKIEEHRTRN